MGIKAAPPPRMTAEQIASMAERMVAEAEAQQDAVQDGKPKKKTGPPPGNAYFVNRRQAERELVRVQNKVRQFDQAVRSGLTASPATPLPGLTPTAAGKILTAIKAYIDSKWKEEELSAQMRLNDQSAMIAGLQKQVEELERMLGQKLQGQGPEEDYEQ